MAYVYIASILICFSLCAVLGRVFIPRLKSLHLGQPILDIGPRWHKSKEGTPTMGGIFMILPVLLVCSVLSFTYLKDDGRLYKFLVSLVMAFMFALIGAVDDAAKLGKKQNEGLKPWQKFMLQLAVSCAYIFILAISGNLGTSLYLPFFKITVELGRYYYAFCAVLICGVVNSVNLTDGIDGLAASVTAAVCAFFSAVGLSSGNRALSLLSGSTSGACLGFLVYNAYPAKIFMGDTGSLFLGGIVCGLAFLADDPLIVLAVGFVYVFEVASVILQILYFKLSRGKRLFKMAPFHHDLEQRGMSENKIVLLLLAVTLFCCVLSYFFK